MTEMLSSETAAVIPGSPQPIPNEIPFPEELPTPCELPQKITMAHIKKIVADHFGITVDALISKKTRARMIVRPRQIAMHFCKELTSHSYPEIGRAFSGQDHSTVIHSCKKVKELSRDDIDFKKVVGEIRKLLTKEEPVSTIEVKISEEETINIPAPPPPSMLKKLDQEIGIMLNIIRQEVADYYDIPVASLMTPPTNEDTKFYCQVVDRLVYQTRMMYSAPPELRNNTEYWEKMPHTGGDQMTRADMRVIWRRLMLHKK